MRIFDKSWFTVKETFQVLYFTPDKFVQQISIRGNSCNPRLNVAVGQAWQKVFELKAQKNHYTFSCGVQYKNGEGLLK